MVKEACQICGYKSKHWALKRYPIIPNEIAQSAGIKESKIVWLCSNCRRELEEWRLTKVSDVVYDTMLKRFRERLPSEMVKEYEYAYNSFVQYKREQRGLG